MNYSGADPRLILIIFVLYKRQTATLKVSGMKSLPYLIIFIAVMVSTPAWSREGNPFLIHFNLPDRVSNTNLGFVQDVNGQMYIHNRNGIYVFDGLQWQNMGLTGRPVSIAYNNRLYYSTEDGVGYFIQNEKGTYEQELILKSPSEGDYYKLIKTDEGVIAVSPHVVCLVSMHNGTSVDTLVSHTDPDIHMSDFFVLGGQMFYVNNYTGIFLYNPAGEPEMIATLTPGEDFTFSFNHGGRQFFGSSANKLYSYSGQNLAQFPLPRENFFRENLLNGGISVSPEEFVLSTVNGGCMIINPSGPREVNMLNYYNGLPDDEISSMGTDNEGGLWIAHGMGITRADLALPVRSFSEYPGLRGNLHISVFHDDIIYAGTSEGLFYLGEERDYRLTEVIDEPQILPGEPAPDPVREQEEIYVDEKTIDQQEQKEPQGEPEGLQEEPEDPQERPEYLQEEPEDPQEGPEEQRSGFISRLFNRITGRDDEIETVDQDELQISEIQEIQEVQEVQEQEPIIRTIQQLQSITYTYKQIPGVRGKVQQFAVLDGSLFVATNLGLFQVVNGTATSILRGKNIHFLEKSEYNSNSLLIGADDGAYLASRNEIIWSVIPLLPENNFRAISIVEIDQGRKLVTTEFDVFMSVRQDENNYSYDAIYLPGRRFNSPVARKIDSEIRTFTADTVYLFNPETGRLTPDRNFIFEESSALFFYQKDYTWIKTGAQWGSFTSDHEIPPIRTNYLNLLDNLNSIYVSEDGDIYAVNGFDQLYRITPGSRIETGRQFGVFLKDIRELSGNLITPDNINLEYANNALRISISAPSYIKEGSVMFQYYITGLTRRWSEWTGDPVLELPYLPAGEYIISIRAKDILGTISEPLNLPYQIKPPFWQTRWFPVISVLTVVLLFVIILLLREQKLKKDKERLEKLVRQRTKTIENQKKILEKHRDNLSKFNREIVTQKKEIETQRDHIFKQNEEMTNSIIYARRIQTAVMPPKEAVEDLLRSYFLIFRPRDIVSGDFYWMTRKNGKVVVVASDCTGHGVPGAFMSMMGVSLLNDIVNVAGVIRPDQILNTLRQKIKATLSQTGRDDEASDGMDIAVCVFDDDRKNLQYAGAYIPMYLIRKGKLIEYKPDKMPVGIHVLEKDSFTLYELGLLPGDKFYIFSDGLVDQFGGPQGKKFKIRPFKELLLRIHELSMTEQKKEIENTLDRWQAAHEQVDDILVIGICIP